MCTNKVIENIEVSSSTNIAIVKSSDQEVQELTVVKTDNGNIVDYKKVTI